MNLCRVVLIVRDFERAVRFYRDTLELPVADEGENWMTFATGAAFSIAGFEEDMPYDPSALGQTPDQLMFGVPDLEAARSQLVARGVQVGVPYSPGGGVRLAEFRDPDGRYLALEEVVTA